VERLVRLRPTRVPARQAQAAAVRAGLQGRPDARAKVDRTCKVLRGTGARRVAVWPDEATLCLWRLPGRDLAVLLFQMTEHGDGNAAYYADVTQAVLTLAVTAPGGPPASAAEFLQRLEPAWLEQAYAAGNPGQLAAITAAKPHLGDIQLRYATLLGRLGPALDGPRQLTDADAWYFILEGTSEPSVAEAQAMAVTELIAYAAVNRTAERRAILLAADDYSAVSRRVPLSNRYERGRSLGLGVMVSAQNQLYDDTATLQAELDALARQARHGHRRRPHRPASLRPRPPHPGTGRDPRGPVRRPGNPLHLPRRPGPDNHPRHHHRHHPRHCHRPGRCPRSTRRHRKPVNGRMFRAAGRCPRSSPRHPKTITHRLCSPVGRSYGDTKRTFIRFPAR
jgi:hypothetical protein